MKFKTVDEYQAEAMLLGCDYDELDHTYVALNNNTGTLIDPETLEVLSSGRFYTKSADIIRNRIAGVRAGMLGFTKHEIAGP